MSFQTTLARAAARDADDAWRAHRFFCPACAAAARRRRSGELCAEGAEARQLRDDLRADARREAWLDAQPPPGQGALFDLSDLP